MKKQPQQIDLRPVWYSVFIFVWMASGEISAEAEPIAYTGIWESPKDAFLKFEESLDNDLSAILFLKSKGFFNLTGTKALATENRTFFLNGMQSGYIVGITGQFLECINRVEQLQVVLQLAADTNCDFDIFSRTSIHTFSQAEESVWFSLESECQLRESDNDYVDNREIAANSSEEENCTLSGFWINEYNSTMNLTVEDTFTRRITGIYQTKHERADGTAGGGITTIRGLKGDNSLFTFAMIWNNGTSVSNFMGISRYIDNGTCILWTDFVLIVAQETCDTSWRFCLLGSYNQWKKLW